MRSILASVLAKNVTYCTNSTKLDKISVRMARTQPGCVGKFSVVVLILMFTKQKNLNLSAQLLTVLFGRQPICTTANFFSRGGSDRPYFLTFLARTQASMIMQLMKQRINTMRIFFIQPNATFIQYVIMFFQIQKFGSSITDILIFINTLGLHRTLFVLWNSFNSF